jgi:hypothetical protein
VNRTDQQKFERSSADRELLLGRCDFLVESQLWPLERNLNYRGWLDNFSENEMVFAEKLLTNFMYFSTDLTKHIFSFAFNRLTASICDLSETAIVCQERWMEFRDSVIITHVTGEDPSPTDSGYHFSRLSRQFLGFRPEQIITNEEAVAKLYFGDRSTVVFVDDFVGSGNQFCDTWDRTWTIATNNHQSFKTLVEEGHRPFKAFYCPVFCTWKGREKIGRLAPQVRITPAHDLDESYSVFSRNSRFWTPDLFDQAQEFLGKVSSRAGLGPDWRGFHNLGLGIAFEHGVPDATLPIYYHESANWLPLLRKT